MATRTFKVCDFDEKHEATETMVIVLDEEAVELDACEPCAKKARDTVQKVMVGRQVTLKDLAKRAGNGAEVDLTAVRLWAAAQTPPIVVAAKGRVAADVIEKYVAATQPSE